MPDTIRTARSTKQTGNIGAGSWDFFVWNLGNTPPAGHYWELLACTVAAEAVLTIGANSKSDLAGLLVGSPTPNPSYGNNIANLDLLSAGQALDAAIGGPGALVANVPFGLSLPITQPLILEAGRYLQVYSYVHNASPAAVQYIMQSTLQYREIELPLGAGEALTSSGTHS